MEHNTSTFTITETTAESTTTTTTITTKTSFALDRDFSSSSSHLTGRTNNDNIIRSPPTQSRRQKTLVRPERERVDTHHRQYHYRQRAANREPDSIAPSSTGNQPFRPSEDHLQQEHQYHHQKDIHLDSTTTNRQSGNIHDTNSEPKMIRRGRSVLGRKTSKRMGGAGHQMVEEEDDDDEDLPGGGAIDLTKPLTFWEKLPDPWLTYCCLLTCCVPSAILSICGKSHCKYICI
ncbi:hypothetical protein BC941DRAFT_415830 [Chlamydoabsidia padenii]|nr:hypothetical protein BC941DRAFT_415830 [Chlamydoabsidia padenii]